MYYKEVEILVTTFPPRQSFLKENRKIMFSVMDLEVCPALKIGDNGLCFYAVKVLSAGT